MPNTIAINGIKLHDVKMPLVPYDKRTLSFLSYPSSQIQCSQNANTLALGIPSLFALELYRTGILPQDTDIPVSVKIGGKPAKEFLITDVRYPISHSGPFDHVQFTLTRIPKIAARTPSAQVESATAPAQQGGYVTDIRHYLDELGELAEMPAPARTLVSFLTLLIDEATSAFPAEDHESRIRCREPDCNGTIRTRLVSKQDEISWRCAVCGHHGVIRNWQDTKWNQTKPDAPLE